MRLPPDVEEWWVFDPAMSCEEYVRQTLEAYRSTPTTLGQVHSCDRDFALHLFRQKVPFTAVEGALILAAARRTFRRDPQRPPLAPIRCLRYFRPVIREILDTPIDPGEISYLWYRLQGRI